jgi:hypothetical protein
LSALPFELVIVPIPNTISENVPSVPDEGIEVPKELFYGAVFRAEREARAVVRPDGTTLVRFGAARLWRALCLDPVTGNVVDIWDYDQPALGSQGMPQWTETLVNTSVQKFVETSRAVSARYPYYDRTAFDTDAGYAAVERVHDELVTMIDDIDGEAGVPDRFWSTFADDVMIGDFYTEDIPSAEPTQAGR